MHLVVHFRPEEYDASMMETLRADRIRTYRSTSGLIVYPDELKKAKKPFMYYVPEYLKKGVIRLVADEEGGKLDTKNGVASIITNDSADKLEPFRIYPYPKTSGKHASFFSTTSLIQIKARWGKKGNTLSIKKLIIKPSHGHIVTLARNRMWKTGWSVYEENYGLELPGIYEHFSVPAEAAINKSLHPCLDIHYAMPCPRAAA